MAKILAKKTPASKSAILLKNKELDKVKEKEKQEQLERKKQVITTVMESAPASVRDPGEAGDKIQCLHHFVGDEAVQTDFFC